jgi:hypothetical protein
MCPCYRCLADNVRFDVCQISGSEAALCEVFLYTIQHFRVLVHLKLSTPVQSYRRATTLIFSSGIESGDNKFTRTFFARPCQIA